MPRIAGKASRERGRLAQGGEFGRARHRRPTRFGRRTIRFRVEDRQLRGNLPRQHAPLDSQLPDQPIDADPLNQPHHVITQSVVLSVSVHGDDVPVSQAGGGGAFPFKAFPHPLGFEIRNDLNRHAAIGRLLAGLEDDAHAAAADFAENAEFAEQLVGQRLDGAVLERRHFTRDTLSSLRAPPGPETVRESGRRTLDIF